MLAASPHFLVALTQVVHELDDREYETYGWASGGDTTVLDRGWYLAQLDVDEPSTIALWVGGESVWVGRPTVLLAAYTVEAGVTGDLLGVAQVPRRASGFGPAGHFPFSRWDERLAADGPTIVTDRAIDSVGAEYVASSRVVSDVTLGIDLCRAARYLRGDMDRPGLDGEVRDRIELHASVGPVVDENS